MRYSIIHPQIHTFSSVTFRLHGNGSRHIWIVVHFQPRFNFVFDRFKWNNQSYESHDQWHSIFWKLCICKLSDWYTDRYACNVRISGNSEILKTADFEWYAIPRGLFLFIFFKCLKVNMLDGWSFTLKSWFLIRLFSIFQPWYGVG